MELGFLCGGREVPMAGDECSDAGQSASRGGSASAGDDAANTTDEVAIEIANGPVGADMALGTESSSETPVDTRGPNATAGLDGRSTRLTVNFEDTRESMPRSSQSFRMRRTIAEQIEEEQKTLAALQVRVSKDQQQPPELFHVDSTRTKNNPTPRRRPTHACVRRISTLPTRSVMQFETWPRPMRYSRTPQA